ncbi:MAG: acetate--CoA ligase, partial [Coriobacteriaceae bacterium]|nr:acetate--CoA ligase [Coriobacteriaceae bacterium]
MSRMTETYIDNLMVNESILSPSDEFSFNANIKSRHERDRMYRRSIEDPESFWAEMADKYLDWFQKWDAVEEFDFYSDKPYVRYFRGAKLNVSYNCLDRHLRGPRRNKAAIIWQGEPDEDARTITYAQLHREVSKAANMLKHLGIEKGDRVVIYMPMIPELAISMLACSRIGAIHCVVFGGLSADSLRDRIQDSGAKVVLTANYGLRSGKLLKTKAICDEALEECPDVESCVVVRRIKDRSPEMIHHRDYWWEDLMERASYDCEPEHMDAEDPLFILYTSGSTAKPKGILHTSGGYLLYATMTTKYVFDLKEDDVYWCTADAGWITGHTYLVYGPLSNGATALMFEGVPSYPEPDRFWEVVEKYGVNILYTAPTTIRAMMKEGDQWPLGRDLSSLRLLGTVGEPITSKAWLWYYTVIGKRRSPIVDTWWQTETGGILITTIPGAIDMKPGSASLPFFGVSPKVINSEGA